MTETIDFKDLHAPTAFWSNLTERIGNIAVHLGGHDVTNSLLRMYIHSCVQESITALGGNRNHDSWVDQFRSWFEDNDHPFVDHVIMLYLDPQVAVNQADETAELQDRCNRHSQAFYNERYRDLASQWALGKELANYAPGQSVSDTIRRLVLNLMYENPDHRPWVKNQRSIDKQSGGQ